MIRDMREKGMSVSEIAKQLGIDRKTVILLYLINFPLLMAGEVLFPL